MSHSRPERVADQIREEITVLLSRHVQDPGVAKQVIRLVDGLEEHEDIQNVFANYEIPGPLLAALRAEAGDR